MAVDTRAVKSHLRQARVFRQLVGVAFEQKRRMGTGPCGIRAVGGSPSLVFDPPGRDERAEGVVTRAKVKGI